MEKMEIFQLSSLAKVFPTTIYGDAAAYGEIAKGQSFSYQIALKGKAGEYTFAVSSPIAQYITAYKVGFVPLTTPTYDTCRDDDYLTKEKGICPDPLFPIKDGKIEVKEGEYATIWLCINLPKDIEAQEYKICFELFDDGASVGNAEFNLTVHNILLPEQKLKFTQWFHTDCIANVHGVEVYSEEHWALIEKYVSVAASHGMNMLLTPILTPPLDTAVGGERTTVQLVKIEKKGKKYTFDFSKAERFIDICLKYGIEYFEINHMFTQWGAKNAPKVVATVDGEEKKIFGWDTDATSKEYVDFLKQLVPAIVEVFENKGIDKNRIYFHVSDEPNDGCITEYANAYKVIKKLIKGCEQVDAISHLEFYKKKIIKTPIVATNAIEPFLAENVPNLWCYYCCAQHEYVSNRFMAMPSYRNRILGVQMYKHSIVGFLQWGYNFYNLQYSKGQINPYEVTDAGGSFPSGDSFSVYPYENGATPSFRMKVFKNALEDVQLLTALEAKIGREAVCQLIDRVAGMEITFKEYPRNEEFFVNLYKEIFKILNDRDGVSYEHNNARNY